jgi:hypothetical protein
MRSAWQEFTIEELKTLRNALLDASREGWLDVMGEDLLVELSAALERRITALPPQDTTDTPDEPQWL